MEDATFERFASGMEHSAEMLPVLMGHLEGHAAELIAAQQAP